MCRATRSFHNGFNGEQSNNYATNSAFVYIRIQTMERYQVLKTKQIDNSITINVGEFYQPMNIIRYSTKNTVNSGCELQVVLSSLVSFKGIGLLVNK